MYIHIKNNNKNNKIDVKMLHIQSIFRCTKSNRRSIHFNGEECNVVEPIPQALMAKIAKRVNASIKEVRRTLKMYITILQYH